MPAASSCEIPKAPCRGSDGWAGGYTSRRPIRRRKPDRQQEVGARDVAARMARLAALALATALVLPPAAGADDSPLQRARESHLSSRPLPKLVFIADTAVRLSRAEWVAGERPLIRVTNAGAHTIDIQLPAVF